MMNNKFLLYSTGNYIQYPVISHNGKEYEKNVYMYNCGEEMATHSSVLAWRIPGTEERGGLLSEITQSRTRLK